MGEADDPLDDLLDRQFRAEMSLGALWAEYDEGDTAAAYKAVLLCKEFSVPIPNWAVDELAKTAAEKLGLEPRKKGRHANPIAEGLDKRNRIAIFCMVTALKRELPNLKGTSRYRLAQLLLRIDYGFFDTESIKSIYHSMKRKNDLENHHLVSFFELFIRNFDFHFIPKE